MFYSETDLHVCQDSLNGAGTPLNLVTHDFDGQPRDLMNPDIGADEFTNPNPVANFGYTRENGNFIQFSDSSAGDGPLSYTWDFGVEK